MFLEELRNYLGEKSFIYNTISVGEDRTIDCHGLTCSDMKVLLDFIISKKGKYVLIFGVGNHSKKPQMDYMTERDWRCPIYKFSVDYLVQNKKGATLQTLPDRIKFTIL